jgi:hypothetical protein
MAQNPSDILQQADLGDLLAGTARAVLQAQDALDAHASQRVTEFVKVPDGEIAVPPVWYTIKNASIEVELSATISDTRLVCQLVNPQNVSLFGYQASAGTRVRMLIGPSGALPIKMEDKPK